MFDLSLAEVMLIVVVAIIFIGPRELPVVIRALGRGMRSLRALAGEVKQAFDELSRETGLKDVTDSINDDVRMIRGDDGKFYEAYDVEKIPQREKVDG